MYGDVSGASLAPLFIPVLLVLLALRRNRRARRIRIETMWILPLVLLALTAYLFAADPPPITPLILAAFAAALALGAVIGWFRGKTTAVSIDPQTHTLSGQTSTAGLLILAAIFALRFAVREVLTRNAGALHIPAAAITDGFLLLAVGMICARRLEVWARCRTLLAQARSTRPDQAA